MILLDVGSTNSRAWLLKDGEVVQRLTAPIGVRDSARTGSTNQVRETVRDLIASLRAWPRETASAANPEEMEPPLICAAGMITSALGLREVPHVAAPASVDDLARHAVWFEDAAIADQPILLVPGVRTPGRAAGSELEAPSLAGDWSADLRADVMRGEETLVCGLLAAGMLDAGAALLNVSSHWKLIAVDDERRIAGSRTSLGGEVVHAVQAGTLLSASLPSGPFERVEPSWLHAGADASRREGLLRAMFAVRLLDQGGQATADERFSWLMGACIAADLDPLLATRALTPGARVLVSGPAAVPSAWAALLAAAGCQARALDAADVERAFIEGLVCVARHRESLTSKASPARS